MRQIACPIALHPDGAPHRIPMFRHPLAGLQFVKGGIRDGERPEAAAARELFEESGLETRNALYLGRSDLIMADTIWHFSLCRLAPPVRPRWQHLCHDDGGHVFQFEWHDLDAPEPVMDEIFLNARKWIKGAL
ncbi:MAG: NUDIX domain-containing protein [Aliishimia sp.]